MTAKELKTISGRIIRITANYSKRTFTIRTESAKFRTYKMTSEEFEDNLMNTGNDWQDFLNGSSDYYRVKLYI